MTSDLLTNLATLANQTGGNSFAAKTATAAIAKIDELTRSSDRFADNREKCAAALFENPVPSFDLFLVDFGLFGGLLDFIGQRACIDWIAAHKSEAAHLETHHAEFLTAVTRHFEAKKLSPGEKAP